MDEDYEEEFVLEKSQARKDRRKKTWRKIHRSYRISVKGESRKGGGLGEKKEVQLHRLYKGPNWDNRGGYAHNTKNLGPNNRDKKTDLNCKEQFEEY